MDAEYILHFSREMGYFCEVEHCSDKSLTLRINISDSGDAITYLKLLEAHTFTNWIRNGELANPERVVFHKYFVCQHSGVNKKTSSKVTDFNTSCPAKLDILIKKLTPGTKRNDKFLKLKPALCGKVTVDLLHNHTIGTSGSLKFMSISDETKATFEEYFNNGMAAAEACRFHESALLVNENPWEMLANTAINPSKNTVYYLHRQHMLKQFGTVFDPIKKLQEKLNFYNTAGIKLAISSNPWAVLIVTPIMERAQALQSSREIIFCDSTCSCDTSETTVTILLTVTKAGAIPIAIILHDGQSTVSYKQAFMLLRNHFPYCFGGHMEPICFMTDDSKAEKSALASVYGKTRQLLCYFHVLQKEWRWLCDKKNKIPLEKRQMLIGLFRKVMYADSTENLNMAISTLKECAAGYEHFVSRFENFFSRGHEWLFINRKNIITRGNNTNNYAEASIRVLKDIILHRTKGYNPVALVDFISFVWEEYFKIKLLDYAHGRRNNIKNSYLKLCSKVSSESCKLVDHGNGFIQISSNSDSLIYYDINVEMGVCTCYSGTNGAFCKHQAYVHQNFNIPFINAPAVTLSERASLGKLALGSDCPNENWFLGLNEHEEILQTSCNVEIKSAENVGNNSDEQINMISSNFADNNEEAGKRESALLAISKEFERLHVLASNVPTNTLEKFSKRLQRISTVPDLYSALNVVIKAPQRKCTSKIKVQPTATSRRRPGVTRGANTIPSGRPPNRVIKRKKRLHNLKSNILLNQANAILHGHAH